VADPLTIYKVRAWCGSAPDDAQVAVALSAADGDVHGAALAILRARRADMVSVGPGKFAVEGDYSQEYTEAQLKRLDAAIVQLETLAPDDPAARGYSVAYLERCGNGR
jgi:hypothetical protein